MVDFEVKDRESKYFKVCIVEDGKEVGRAFLFLIVNDLNSRPYGFVEDVFIDESFRGDGLGKRLMKKVVNLAEEKDCYKLVFCSRFGKDKLHEYYEMQGFDKHGFCFRKNF